MNILIYTPKAFPLSETFIYYQYKYNKAHNIIGATSNFVSGNFMKLENPVFLIAPKPKNLIDRIISFIIRRLKREKESFSFFSLLKIKKIIKKNNIQLVHINYGTSAYSFSFLTKIKIPFIIHFHGYDASSKLSDKNYLKKLKLILPKACKIIVVSDEMKNNIINYVDKSIENKIVTIPYGVDIDKITNFTSQFSNNETIKVLHVGRLTPKKGVPDLVKVFHQIIKEIDNVQLNIIGSGEEFQIIQKYINKNKLTDKIILHGAKKQDFVISFLHKTDIFVLNSRTAPNGDKEGFPNVIIEAMAAKKAIISTYHAGIPMAISNMQEGLLVEEKNNAQLKTALMKLIQDKTLREKLAGNAFEKVTKNFTINKMLQNINKVYNDCSK